MILRMEQTLFLRNVDRIRNIIASVKTLSLQSLTTEKLQVNTLNGVMWKKVEQQLDQLSIRSFELFKYDFLNKVKTEKRIFINFNPILNETFQRISRLNALIPDSPLSIWTESIPLFTKNVQQNKWYDVQIPGCAS
jgi:hypothetical protein